jgi:hypothetical protein
MKKILLVGLLPEVVDFSSMPDLTAKKLRTSLRTQERDLCDMGFDAKWCLVDRGETAEAVVRSALEASAYDVVLIGAGVRTIPAQFGLFEKLVNIVHQHATTAKICFNTKPDDTSDAVLRWIAAPSAAG